MRTNRLKSWHRWIGLPIAFFALMFACSGIVLNHRKAVSQIDISRDWLPQEFQIKNWNLGNTRATIYIGGDSVLMYGAGVWLTNKRHSFVERFGEGLKSGVDNQNVAKIVRTAQNELFAVTTFDLYQLDRKSNLWQNISSRINTPERLTGITLGGDTLVVASRSELFIATAPYEKFHRQELAAPVNYDGKVSLFRTIWRLHSGELFGTAGKVVVDILGLFTIILSISGIIIFFFPIIIRRLKQENKAGYISILRLSYRWHNKPGYWLTALLVILFGSGLFLRPPFMIAIIKGRTLPLLFSTLDNTNPWNDRLRTIEYDTAHQVWLLYSSEGFFELETLKSKPEPIMNAPQVSVMGINVLQQMNADDWIVGSFDGLVLWDRSCGRVIDCITNRPLIDRKSRIPDENIAITGFSSDFLAGNIAFSYFSGAQYIQSNRQFIQMPIDESTNRISLWHLCQEIHTGRIYKPMIGLLSELFIFIFGSALLIVVLTGYVIYAKQRKRLR